MVHNILALTKDVMYLPIENIIEESFRLDRIESRDVVDDNTCIEKKRCSDRVYHHTTVTESNYKSLGNLVINIYYEFSSA